ncbi:hypothetical protein [Microvirga tunisiensis]|uniref:Uncharacterized protein n=1 Tax=Microvirga tunisiensis TaxID=2108360 RepID=A0A5N7MS48_9HYPH|nr:hypothetical protein [Microvirga tunisiensis]MPR11853.1 hypothetical protein [Microvirga tunisiensis]MPR29815.1 hypothetical protein [Microvirga tunisiensis]
MLDYDAWMEDFSKGLDNIADAINVNPTIQVNANTNVIGVGVGNTVDDIFIDQSQHNFTQQSADADAGGYQGPEYHLGDNIADAINVNPTIQVNANTNLIGIGTGNDVSHVDIDQSQHNFTDQDAFAHAFA